MAARDIVQQTLLGLPGLTTPGADVLLEAISATDTTPGSSSSSSSSSSSMMPAGGTDTEEGENGIATAGAGAGVKAVPPGTSAGRILIGAYHNCAGVCVRGLSWFLSFLGGLAVINSSPSCPIHPPATTQRSSIRGPGAIEASDRLYHHRRSPCQSTLASTQAA